MSFPTGTSSDGVDAREDVAASADTAAVSDGADVADAVSDGIAAAYEQAAGAPVDEALETVLEEEEARGVHLNEEFARPFAEAISRGEDPLPEP